MFSEAQLSTHNCAQRLVAHLGSQCIHADGDEFEASGIPAVRAFRSNSFIVEHLVLINLQPHELKALWAGSDLR